jgi:hypothetical protein
MSSEEYDDWSGLLAMNATVIAYGIAEKYPAFDPPADRAAASAPIVVLRRAA